MYAFKLAVALTGAAEASITVDTVIPLTLPTTGTITVDTNGAAEVVVDYSSYSGSTYAVTPTDFSGDYASIGNDAKQSDNFVKSYDVAQYGNLFIDGEIVSSFGGNNQYDFGDVSARFSGFTYQDNVAIDIGKSQNTGRDIGWVTDAVDNTDSVITDNYALPVDNVSITNKFAISVYGYSNNVDVQNNISFGAGPITTLNGDSFSNADSLVSGDFFDATRTLPTYMTSIGGTPTNEALAAELTNLSSLSDPLYKVGTINGYLKAGFAVIGVKLIDDISSISVTEGDVITLSPDAISSTALTYQWFDALTDNPLSGETGREYSITSTLADNARQVYWVATDEALATVQSSTSTFTVAATAPAPVYSGTFALPDAVDGDAYSYDASVYFTGTVVSYTLESGTMGSGISFNTSTGVFSGTASGTTDLTGLSISATNAAGTSSTSNTATLVVNAASVSHLTFNGSTGYAAFDQIVFADEFELEFEFVGTATSVVLGHVSWNDRIIVDDTKVTITTFSGSLDLVGAGLLDGSRHTIQIARDSSDNVTGLFDGVPTSTLVRSNATGFNLVANTKGTVTATPMSISNLVMDNLTPRTVYAIDSGSTTFEAASVGIGTMLFVNVIAGDWS